MTAKSPKPTSETEAKNAEPVVILKKQPRILDPNEITARQSSIEKGKEFVKIVFFFVLKSKLFLKLANF